MFQSTSAHSSSRASYGKFVDRRPLRITLGRFRLSSFARLLIASAVVVAASVATFMQSPRPDAHRAPRWVVSMAWWSYPLEWNAPNRLPKVDCSLKAIHAVPNSDSIWAVGNKGMVVSSSDGGTTWIKKGIEDSQLAGETASASRSSSSFLEWLDFVPRASAQEKQPNEPNRSIRKAEPTPTRDPKAYPGLTTKSVPQNEKSDITPQDNAAPRPTATPFRATQVAPRGLTREQTRAAFRPAQSARITQPRPVNPSASPDPSATANPSPTPVPIPPPSPETEQLIAVYFVDDKSGEAVDGRGWRYTTTDGGSSWKQDLIDATFFRLGADKGQPPLRFLQLDPNERIAAKYFAVNQSGQMFRIDNLSYQRRDLPQLGNFIPYGVGFLRDADMGWVVGSGGTVYRSREGSGTEANQWEPLKTQSTEDLHGVFFVDQNRGWVTGSQGAIFATNDSGTTWTRQTSGTTIQLNAVNFLPDGQHGWIAGDKGIILSTSDGGNTWVHRTQGAVTGNGRYLRFPAPWYFLGLFLLGALLWRKPQDAEAAPEESVADVLVSDRPLEEATGDVLAFNIIARSLSRFLRNENTLPPLTIAITGEWGTGKSSLMNLLRGDLRSYGFRPVWFNAWHHQKEEHILASLLENIKLQAVPRWWTTSGVVFRARLLRIRGVRQWGPLVLLLFFIYVVAMYYYYAEGGVAENFKIPLTLAEVIDVLPILAGVATFAGALWRGIHAFGVKPASLLAGVSRGVSIRGLEAQTSFRQKFAVEFNDVTQALGKRSMLIFIDDLDRCRPENVLETLEAVNFLTTSGECFVVIGMAREYVERCVGRAFNEVAQEMVDDLEEEFKESAEDIAKQKRIEFARQYLDKLINIEVPVPAPKQSQSLALLVASTREFETSAPQSDWERFRLSLVNFIARRWKLVPTLLAAGVLIVLGHYMARGLAVNGKSQVVVSKTGTLSTAPMPEPEVKESAAVSPASDESPLLTSSPSASPTPIPTPDTENAVLVPGARAVFSPGILPLLAFLALVWLASTILTRKSGLEVKDSARFVDALEIWHPLVYARLCTPRATKRFMNFVRYLAMRQRRQTDSESPLKRFLAALRQRLAGGKTFKDAVALVDDESSAQQIPDEVLVALAALQHLNPECLADQPGPVSSPDQVWPRAMPKDNPLWPLFDKARAKHEATFHNWGALSQYRESFREMTANVQVR